MMGGNCSGRVWQDMAEGARAGARQIFEFLHRKHDAALGQSDKVCVVRLDR